MAYKSKNDDKTFMILSAKMNTHFNTFIFKSNLKHISFPNLGKLCTIGQQRGISRDDT